MSEGFMEDRRRALEAAFFAKHNEELRQKLIARSQTAAKKSALSAASGITDDAVLNTLVALDIRGDTLAALSLAPLVAVAWADGEIDAKERAAVLSRAVEAGLGAQDPCYAMLDQWLGTRPPPSLIASWKAYIASVSATLGPEARQALKSDILGRARAVAEAAGGGILGLGRKASAAEERVLHELSEALA